MILLLCKRSHLGSKQQATKDFFKVQDGESRFPAAEAALISRVLADGALGWKNVGFASVSVVEEDRQGDVLDADYERWDAGGDVGRK